MVEHQCALHDMSRLLFWGLLHPKKVLRSRTNLNGETVLHLLSGI